MTVLGREVGAVSRRGSRERGCATVSAPRVVFRHKESRDVGRMSSSAQPNSASPGSGAWLFAGTELASD